MRQQLSFEKFQDGQIIHFPEKKTTVFKLHSISENPILKPQDFGLLWLENNKMYYGAIFNGGATIFRDTIILAPRIHTMYHRFQFFDDNLGIRRFGFKNYISEVWLLKSIDGIHFQRFDNKTIKGDGTNHKDFIYGIEDVRIIKIGEKYWLIGCGKIKPPFHQPKINGNGDTTAIYSTKDFSTITYHGNIPIDSRNTVLFPEEINGKYYVLFRYRKHIFIESLGESLEPLEHPKKYTQLWKEMYRRKEKTILLHAGTTSHEKEKIGAGPPPIKTNEGWLLIYHSVGQLDKTITNIYHLPSEIPRAYSVNAALLDLDDPRRVLCRTTVPIYIPHHSWELYGSETYPVDIPAVVFPTGAIVHNEYLLLYAGAGDKYMVLLTTKLNTLINYLVDHCQINQRKI